MQFKGRKEGERKKERKTTRILKIRSFLFKVFYFENILCFLLVFYSLHLDVWSIWNLFWWRETSSGATRVVVFCSVPRWLARWPDLIYTIKQIPEQNCVSILGFTILFWSLCLSVCLSIGRNQTAYLLTSLLSLFRIFRVIFSIYFP